MVNFRALAAPMLLLALGCSRDRSEKAQPSAAPSAEPREAASGPRDGAGALQGGSRCPSRVPGAETSITDVEGGVELRVTAKDPGAVAAIRARIAAFSGSGGDAPAVWARCDPSKPVTPNGGCPLVHDGTRVSGREVEGGAVFAITTEAAAVQCLRLQVRARAGKLQKP